MSAAVLDLRPAAQEPIGNIDAEFALLGAALYDNRTFALCGDVLRGEHFSEPLVGWLWDQARAVAARGELAEPITLHELAKAYGPAYEEMGGIVFLATLSEKAPQAEHGPEYVRIIYDCHVRRCALKACQDASRALVADRDRPAFQIVSEARTGLERLETEGAPEDALMISAPDAAAAAILSMEDMAAHGRPRGCMTGLRCIDYRLNGLKPGAMVVVGGRPGMGKTGLGRAMAHGAAVRNPGKRFLFLGIEMGPEEMMQRELSALTYELGDGVEHRAMGSGALTPMDLMNIRQAHQRVPPNLSLVDCADLSVDDVRRRVWSLARKGPVGAIFIDYLQIMRRPAGHGRSDASVLAEMTGALKQLARQAKLTVVLLSQLNRSVEGRDDKRPQLSDLRDSGSIEQDADAVLFPFREFYYVQKAEPKPGTSEYLDWEMRCSDLRRRLDVICAKQRGGPEGWDRQRYFAEYDFIEDHHDDA